jgi:hypothetical protein
MSTTIPDLVLPTENTGNFDTVEASAVGPVPFVLWERITKSGVTAAAGEASFVLTHKLPARSIVTHYSMKSLATDLEIDTGTHVALGYSTDLDAFTEVLEADMESNEEDFGVPDIAQSPLSAATSVQIASTTAGGVAAGTLDNFDIYVVIWGVILPGILDA